MVGLVRIGNLETFFWGRAQFMPQRYSREKTRARDGCVTSSFCSRHWASGSAVSADLSSPRVLVPTLEAFCKARHGARQDPTRSRICGLTISLVRTGVRHLSINKRPLGAHA